MYIYRSNLKLFILTCSLFFYCSSFQVAADSQNLNIQALDLAEVIKITLENQPEIKLYQKNVEIQKGALQEESGKFDLVLTATVGLTHNTYSPSTSIWAEGIEGDEALYGINFEKLYRSGITISPGIELSRTDFMGYPDDPKKNIKIDFLVKVPLLKGRGREATCANEMVAEKNLEISMLEKQHNISQTVFQAISTYWDYLAFNKKLDQLKNSEERAKRLVKETEIMIQAGKLSPSEMEPIMANLSDKIAFRISGSQDFLVAKQSLGLVMGLQLNESISLSDPGDHFPIPNTHLINKLENKFGKFLKLSFEKRADYLASKVKQDIGKILVNAAENNLRRQVDLNMGVGYSGITKDDIFYHYLTPWGEDESGTRVTLSVDYKFPVANSSARGILVQRHSAYDQYTIETENLARKISSGIFVSITALQRSTSELKQAQKAVASYQRAVNNEQKKFKLGINTLNDVISMEDRLTDSLLNEISAQLKYANALLQLRFETGCLLNFKKNSDTPILMNGVVSLSQLLD